MRSSFKLLLKKFDYQKFLKKSYLTLTGPFPGRWPRLICFPGRRVGFRWFRGGRWVVSSGRARNWKDGCHCLGMDHCYQKLCLFPENGDFIFKLTWLSAGWTGGALGRLEGAEVGWPGRRVGPEGKGGSLLYYQFDGREVVIYAQGWHMKMVTYWVGPDGRGSSSS